MRSTAGAKMRSTCCLPPVLISTFLKPPASGAPNALPNSCAGTPIYPTPGPPNGFTPLHFAAFFGQEVIAVQLLQHGADPAAQAKNPMKVMPLHSAAAAHNLAIVRTLLEHGAPPNARQEHGWTAIHEAAQNGDQAMVELLLKCGADRSPANDDGTTPLDLATKNGHTEIAKLLAAS
jgi:uncharacterized protein